MEKSVRQKLKLFAKGSMRINAVNPQGASKVPQFQLEARQQTPPREEEWRRGVGNRWVRRTPLPLKSSKTA